MSPRCSCPPALSRLRQGDPDGAGGAAAQALTFLRVGSGEAPLDAVTAGAALRTIAHAFRIKGELGEAIGAYMQAIEILRAHPGETYASTLNNFGALQSHLGAPESARATYEEALRIIDTADPESPERASILLNLGIAERELGWVMKAFDWLEQAADAFRQAGDHDRTAQAEHYLAEAYMQQSDVVSARRHNDRALAITEQYSPASELHARGLFLRGRLLLREEDGANALPPLEHAAECFDRLATGSRDAIAVWRAVAEAQLSRDDLDAAIDADRCAVRASETLRQSVARGRPRRELTGYGAAARADLVALLLHRDTPGDRAEAVNVLEARSARALLDTLGLPAQSEKSREDERALRDQRLEFERALAQHHRAKTLVDAGHPTPITKAKLAQVYASAIQGLMLVDHHLQVPNEEERTLTCEEIAAAQRPNEATVITFDGTVTAAVLTIVGQDPNPVAHVVTREQVLRNVESVHDAIAASTQPEEQALLGLSGFLLSAVPPEVTQLTIVTDGIFHRLPWAALADPHERLPLGVARQLTHVASVTSAQRSLTATGITTPARDLLVLADPAYTATQVPMESERTLEGTRRELDALRALVDDLESFTGRDATETNLVAAASAFRRLHIACHGRPDSKDAFYGGLLLAEPLPGDSDRYPKPDDLLEPWETAAMKLQCDTVVLSTCESDSGSLVPGEGLVGLVHAFQLAGARQVLASLWPVGDETTATFMRELYTYLGAGTGLAQAVQATRRKLWQHLPARQWAAWVAHGFDPAHRDDAPT